MSHVFMVWLRMAIRSRVPSHATPSSELSFGLAIVDEEGSHMDNKTDNRNNNTSKSKSEQASINTPQRSGPTAARWALKPFHKVPHVSFCSAWVFHQMRGGGTMTL